MQDNLFTGYTFIFIALPVLVNAVEWVELGIAGTRCAKARRRDAGE